MILELPQQHPVSDTRPLRDSLGHTPVEVMAGRWWGWWWGTCTTTCGSRSGGRSAARRRGID